MDTGDTGCCHWWRCVTAMNSRPDQTRPRSRSVGWWREAAARRLARGGHTGTATLHGPERGHDAMTSWHTPHMLHTESWVRVRGHWRVNLLRWGEVEVVWTDAAVAGGTSRTGDKQTHKQWVSWNPKSMICTQESWNVCREWRWSYVKTTLNIYLSWLI